MGDVGNCHGLMSDSSVCLLLPLFKPLPSGFVLFLGDPPPSVSCVHQDQRIGPGHATWGGPKSLCQVKSTAACSR